MVSLEDMQGWLLVLSRWQPVSTVDKSLFALLDTVKVGSGEDSEESALSLIDGLDPVSYRQLAHIPSRQELLANGWELEMVDHVDQAMEAQLAGVRRGIEIRNGNERALVKAYNKIKHMMLAFPQYGPDQTVVAIRTAKSGPRAYHTLPITIDGADLGCSPEEIRFRARQTIQTQAVLNSLLGLILLSRYDHRIPTPQWALDSLDLPWRPREQ